MTVIWKDRSCFSNDRRIHQIDTHLRLITFHNVIKYVAKFLEPYQGYKNLAVLHYVNPGVEFI